MITYSAFQLSGVLSGILVLEGRGRAGIALEIRGGGELPWKVWAAPYYGPAVERLRGSMVRITGRISTSAVRGERQTLVLTSIESCEGDLRQEDLPEEMGADLGWL